MAQIYEQYGIVNTTLKRPETTTQETSSQQNYEFFSYSSTMNIISIGLNLIKVIINHVKYANLTSYRSTVRLYLFDFLMIFFRFFFSLFFVFSLYDAAKQACEPKMWTWVKASLILVIHNFPFFNLKIFSRKLKKKFCDELF